MEIWTRDKAIEWVMQRIDAYTREHAVPDTWAANVELLRRYFDTTPKTGATIVNDGGTYARSLFPYLAERNLQIDKLDENHVSEIAAGMMKQEPSTVMANTQNIMAFINWVRGRQRLPTLKIKYVVIKRGEAVSNIIEDRLTDEDIRRLVMEIKGDRTKLAVLLMVKYGLRISEALGVRASDFEPGRDGSVLVIKYRVGDYGAKGPKAERRIPRAVLSKYNLLTDADKADLEALIKATLKGVEGDRDKRLIGLTKRAVQSSVERAAARAGIKFHVHPHLFRHHFVAQAVKKGVPINILSVITGDRPETLNKYYIWLSPDAMLA